MRTGVRGGAAHAAHGRDAGGSSHRRRRRHARGGRERVPAAHRAGEAGVRARGRAAVPRRHRGHRRRGEGAIRFRQGDLPGAGAADPVLRPRRRHQPSPPRLRHRPRDRGLLPGAPRRVQAGRGDLRQPHPGQGQARRRGQGGPRRRRGEEDRPGNPRRGEGGQGLRGLGPEALGGPGLGRAGRKPRLLRPRPHGPRVRERRLLARRRRDVRPRQVPVRLPHHPGDRAQGRGGHAPLPGEGAHPPGDTHRARAHPRGREDAVDGRHPEARQEPRSGGAGRGPERAEEPAPGAGQAGPAPRLPRPPRAGLRPAQGRHLPRAAGRPRRVRVHRPRRHQPSRLPGAEGRPGPYQGRPHRGEGARPRAGAREPGAGPGREGRAR